ncbi:MAG: putative Co/Zn/Cd efflux system rane fusion protein [Labilithrix sp.]|nr:putative Co/Zn/Cd efflux system rane fusion protein [Labilithrix sp.]
MRYLVAVGGLLLVVGLLVAIKFTQISGLIKMGKEMEKAGPPPEVVSTAVAKEDTWEGTVSAVGTISAVKGVQVSNDAPGVVTAIRFDSGQVVKQGDILVELDSNVERAQIAALEARRELASTNAGRTRALVASNSIPKSQLDSDEALVKSSQSDLSALQAQIARKVVRAPFSGRLGIRAINVGQYLNPGTAITTLESMNDLFVDFSLPQQNLADIHEGSVIHVRLEGEADASAPFDGVVKAVDPTIDPMTRTIKARATLPANDKLRAGMFANVELVLPQQKKLVIMPVIGVAHASFGDSVFIVENGKARQTFVRTGASRGDFVAILDGVKPGDEVVTAGAFKLRNGSGVTVNNTVALPASTAPRPENH